MTDAPPHPRIPANDNSLPPGVKYVGPASALVVAALWVRRQIAGLR